MPSATAFGSQGNGARAEPRDAAVSRIGRAAASRRDTAQRRGAQIAITEQVRTPPTPRGGEDRDYVAGVDAEDVHDSGEVELSECERDRAHSAERGEYRGEETIVVHRIPFCRSGCELRTSGAAESVGAESEQGAEIACGVPSDGSRSRAERRFGVRRGSRVRARCSRRSRRRGRAPGRTAVATLSKPSP